MMHKPRILLPVIFFCTLMVAQFLVTAQDPTPPLPPATVTTTPVPTTEQTIVVGEPVEIAIEANRTDHLLLNFTGQAKETIRITVKMDLLVPDERTVRLDDIRDIYDNKIGWELPYYELTESGQYSLRIMPWGEQARVWVQITDPAAAIPISYNEVVEGAIDDASDSISYAFTAEAEDKIIVDIDTNGFDYSVEVYCANRDECGSGNGISNEPYNEDHLLYLPKAGTYRLEIKKQNMGGTFSLALSPLRPTPIAYGETVQASFGDGQVMQQFSFEGKFGEIIQFTVDGEGDVDRRVELLRFNGLVEMDDDSGAGMNPELVNVLLPVDGSYTLLVRPYRLGDSGTVEVTLEGTPPPSLDDAAQIITLSRKFTAAAALFTGEAGKQVRLTMRSIGVGISNYVTVKQNGNDLAQLSERSELSTVFTVPESGLVYVNVNGNTPIELTLERID
ncbi:MAG: hypothetical protein LCI00_25995 [Chloroflexi bacterium]|nr:hypothetical protein [Chloroflexota bacterium]MCC6895323.1 hypothetical protein [Anaerolineae bacterium]